MRKTMTIAVILVLLPAALAIAQLHQGGWCDPEAGSGLMRGHRHNLGSRAEGPGVGVLLAVADELDLTDKQRKDLQTMQVEFKTQQIENRANLEKAELQMRTLMRDDDAPESDVMLAIDEVARMRAELHKMRYLHRRQVRQLLTDEQVDRLKELRSERREERREFRQKRGAWRPGTHRSGR